MAKKPVNTANGVDREHRPPREHRDRPPRENYEGRDYYQQDREEYGGFRGGYRGGRGGYRGGRGGRGGYQYRPKNAVEGDEGMIVGEQREVRNNFGYRSKRIGFAGKPREEYHPYDRQDGTGRGYRGPKRQGFGKGNWGNEVMIYKKKGDPDPEYVPKETKEEENAEEVKDEQQNGEEEHRENRREGRYGDRRRKGDEQDGEPVEEEEEVQGLTLEEYKAQQRAKQANLMKAEARKNEAVTAKNIEKVDL